jgi:hypothetical protein
MSEIAGIVFIAIMLVLSVIGIRSFVIELRNRDK